MRRFSQRSSLVTLSEINITPLLDLAFVLLIIFVITTPLLDQGIKLTLPTGGNEEKKAPDKKDIRTVDIAADGSIFLNRTRVTLNEMETELVRDFRANPNLIIYIRADQAGRNKELFAVLDRCQHNGISRYSLRTEPPKAK